jgi:hypothetical protein
MKKILFIAICIAVFSSCKKSESLPVTPKPVDKNLVIEVTCTIPCGVQVDTTLSNKSVYTFFDKKDNITSYRNSLDATGGKSLISVMVYDLKFPPDPASVKTIKMTYKGTVLVNKSYDAYTTDFRYGIGIPNL